MSEPAYSRPGHPVRDGCCSSRESCCGCAIDGTPRGSSSEVLAPSAEVILIADPVEAIADPAPSSSTESAFWIRVSESSTRAAAPRGRTKEIRTFEGSSGEIIPTITPYVAAYEALTQLLPCPSRGSGTTRQTVLRPGTSQPGPFTVRTPLASLAFLPCLCGDAIADATSAGITSPGSASAASKTGNDAATTGSTSEIIAASSTGVGLGAPSLPMAVEAIDAPAMIKPAPTATSRKSFSMALPPIRTPSVLQRSRFEYWRF